MGGFQLCDVTASSHTLSTEFLSCSSKSWPPYPPAPLGAVVQTVTRITETTVEVDQLGAGVRIVGVTSTKQETQVALENSFVTYANPRITTTKIAI